jgi:hypothetical protein
MTCWHWKTQVALENGATSGFIQTLLLEIPPLSTHLSITEKDGVSEIPSYGHWTGGK